MTTAEETLERINEVADRLSSDEISLTDFANAVLVILDDAENT